ncbi:MAG: hydrolase [Rhodospirillales bacterium]|nr:hydrolase [Rhodospirillales bacterium]
MLITADQSCLLIVDVQAKLASAVEECERVIANCAALMQVAARLRVAVLVSEQYPKGLGPTVPELAELAPAGSLMVKEHFSCMGDAGCAGRIQGLDRPQVVVAGIEAHVCVLQTAFGLLNEDRQVFVVADAVSSRSAQDCRLALDRLRDGGVSIVTTEMVLFEWVGRAGTAEFKKLSEMLKNKQA